MKARTLTRLANASLYMLIPSTLVAMLSLMVIPFTAPGSDIDGLILVFLVSFSFAVLFATLGSVLTWSAQVAEDMAMSRMWREIQEANTKNQ